MDDEKLAITEEELGGVSGGGDDKPSWEPYDNNRDGVVFQCPNCGSTNLKSIKLNFATLYRCYACETTFNAEDCYHLNRASF